MKQYVSRGRRCWILLVQMSPVTHLSEGHRSHMLLDKSGLTREERVMVQRFQSVTNAILTELLTHSSFNIHVFISEKVKDEQRAKAKTVSNVLRIQTPVGFEEKANANTLAAENLKQVLIT